MHYTNLGEKVKAWRLATRLTVPAFAKLVGTSRQNIENLEQGGVDLPRYVAKLAKAAGVQVEELLDLRRPVPIKDGEPNGVITDLEESSQRDYKTGPNNPEVRTVAIYQKPPNLIGVAAAERETAYESAPTTGNVGPNGYALRVPGTSMLNPHGSPSFPPGSIIFVNPDMPHSVGMFIVTQLPGDDTFTFRRLIKEAGAYYLEPLNPKFEMRELPKGAPILGVVVAMGMDLL